MAISHWTIDSSSINFPENFSVHLGDRVRNNCLEPELFKVVRNENGRTEIKFELPGVITDAISVKIVDLGADCKNDKLFFEGNDLKPLNLEIPDRLAFTSTLILEN